MELDEPPEELLNIKWGSSLEHQKDFLSENYLQKNSAAYRILNDDFTREWSSDSGDEHRWKKVQPVMEKPKKKPSPQVHHLYRQFTAYPKTSSLTINQHRTYLQLMKKFSCKISPHMSLQDQKEFEKYQNLQYKVAGEQMEYLEFLKNFALTNQSRYSSINEDIRRYVNERWKVKLKNPLKYPRYYRPYRTVGLVSNDAKEPLDFISLDVIHNKGRVYTLNMNKKCKRIERDYSKIVQKHPIITEEIANNPSRTTFNCPVSKDPNAEVFAEKMNVDFVLSSSGLKKICDNFSPFNKFWEIPVIVKECNVEENGVLVKKRVIFIDKALPHRKMTVVDKLFSYHKLAVKRYYVDYRVRDFYQSPESGDDSGMQTKEVVEDAVDVDWDNMNDLDCFGVDGPSPSRGKAENLDKDLENSQSSELRFVSKQPSNEMCAPQEKCEQGDGDAMENNANAMDTNGSGMENSGDVDLSSVCTSDSDDEHLVIDDPESNGDAKDKTKSKKSHSSSSKNSGKALSKFIETDAASPLSSEERPKRQTRRMSKMLQTINKMQEMASAGINNSKVHLVENSKSGGFVKTSPNKEVNGEQSDFVVSSKSKASKNELSLLDQLLEQQKKWLEQEQRPKSELCPRIPVDIIERKNSLRNYRAIPPPRACNHVYRLFTLKKKDAFSPGYRLLIRHKIDGQEPSSRQKCATIIPKLEFQPEFGAEIVTVSEMIQEWLALQIRPFSFLMRARIDAFTSDIIMMEQKELKDLRKEEKYHNVQASSCLNTLETVLRAFRDLPVGEYIFTHEPKMGAFANIYMATNDARDGMYDLHAQYDVDTTAEEPHVLSNLWVPIDFSIITPLLEKLERVPGTFIPKESKVKKKKPKKTKQGSENADSSSVTTA